MPPFDPVDDGETGKEGSGEGNFLRELVFSKKHTKLLSEKDFKTSKGTLG